MQRFGNVLADLLSCKSLGNNVVVTPTDDYRVSMDLLCMTGTYDTVRKNLKQIRKDQLNDSDLGAKLRFLETYYREPRVIFNTKRTVEWFLVHKEILIRRGDDSSPNHALCVPKVQIKALLEQQYEEHWAFWKNKNIHSYAQNILFSEDAKNNSSHNGRLRFMSTNKIKITRTDLLILL